MTEPAQRRPTPALWSHVLKVYRAMEDRAELGPLTAVDTPPEDMEVETGLVYAGNLTKLFQQMEIPNPYYTSVTHALKGMGCIHQLRRGGGSSPSRWALLKQPIEDEFVNWTPSSSSVKQHLGSAAITNQRLRDLTRMVQELTTRVEKLEARQEKL